MLICVWWESYQVLRNNFLVFSNGGDIEQRNLHCKRNCGGCGWQRHQIIYVCNKRMNVVSTSHWKSLFQTILFDGACWIFTHSLKPRNPINGIDEKKIGMPNHFWYTSMAGIILENLVKCCYFSKMSAEAHSMKSPNQYTHTPTSNCIPQAL